MRLPNIPGVWRVAIEHRVSTAPLSDLSVNVLHVLGAEEGSATTLAAHLDAAITGHTPFAALGAGFGVENCTLRITKLDGTTPTSTHTVTDPAWTGSGPGDTIPNMACGVTLYTAKRGRSYRGRVFIGPISESIQDNGLLSEGVVEDTSSGWAGWADAYAAIGAGRSFAVASYKLRTAEPVTNVLAHREARSMRTRLTRLR